MKVPWPRAATLIVGALLMAVGCSWAPGDRAAEIDFEVYDSGETALQAGNFGQLERSLQSRGTHSLLIVQHGRIIEEWYAEGHGPNTRHYTASLAKSLFGGLSLALALDRGWLEQATRVAEFYEPWSEDPWKSRITVGQLAAHISGLADSEESGIPHGELTGWKGAFWQRDPANNPFRVALDQAPVLFEPGTAFGYSNPGYAVLAYVVGAAAQRAKEADVVATLRHEIMEPLGIPDAAWSVGYGRRFAVDGVDAVPNWGGGNYTARAAARVGQLYLDESWREKTAVDRSPLLATTTPSGFPSESGTGGPAPQTTLGWYSNANRAFAQLPADAIVGAGAGHQVLLIVPSMDLVTVRFGNSLEGPGHETFWQALDEYFFRPLMAALRRDVAP